MDKIYDIQKAIVMKDEVALALLDTRYKAVMIIKPDGDKFAISEPDGEERIAWLLRLKMLTVEDAQVESDKLEITQKRKLYDRLKTELEGKLG